MITGGTGLKQWSAPETRSQLTYTENCDIWSAGCILYYLITGKELGPDQGGEDKLETVLDAVTQSDYDDVRTLLDFVQRVMCVAPHERITSA